MPLTFLKSAFKSLKQDSREHARRYQILVIALAYFITGRLGLLIHFASSEITLIWLPTGISIAAFLRYGYRIWPAIAIGSVLVELAIGSSLGLALAIAVGAVLGPLTSAYLLNKFKFNHAIATLNDISYLIIATLVGMFITSGLGVLSLLQFNALIPQTILNAITPSVTYSAWLFWWLGDTVGVFLALPLCLIGEKAWKKAWSIKAQFLPYVLFVAVVEWLTFELVSYGYGQFMLLGFVVLPFIIWSAMRYGLIAAQINVLMASIVAALCTAETYGLFRQEVDHQAIFTIWIFICTLSLVVLLINMLQSERDLIDQNLRDSESKFKAVINGALDGIVTIDDTGHLIEFNPAAERIFGYTRQQVIGRPLANVIIPESQRNAHNQAHQHFVRTGKKHIFDQRLEFTACRADGSEFPVELTITSLQNVGLPYITGFIRDVTDRKKAEDEIKNLAFYDTLTKLPNRRLLIDRLDQAYATSTRLKRHGGLVFIDLDNFKLLNDGYGHDVGDKLLLETAERLQMAVREQDTVARFGGDEFVILMENLSDDYRIAALQAKLVADKILSMVNKPFYLTTNSGHDIQHQSTASIGVSLFSGSAVSVSELLKRADTAMYEAKATGKNAVRFFDPAMQKVLEKKGMMESQLRGAYEQHKLQLFYQAQVDEDEKIIAVEALLRWNHPEHGWVPPIEFIRLAEETGLIIRIGHWVMLQACKQLKAWEKNSSTQHLRISVNVSAKQFRDPDFIDDIQVLLKETGINPELFKLELTETVALENIEEAIFKMQALRELGVSLVMDDFGVGYSSLSYLKRLPFSQVKIDRSFVNDMAHDQGDAEIVHSIITLGAILGLDVVAEGVETQAQFMLLKQYGCKIFQGYLFAKALPIDELEALVYQQSA